MTTQVLTTLGPRKDGVPCHFRRACRVRTGSTRYPYPQAREPQLAGPIAPQFKRAASDANRRHCALQAHSPRSADSLLAALRAFGDAFVRPRSPGRRVLARLLSGVEWL